MRRVPSETSDGDADRYRRLQVTAFVLTWSAYAAFYLCRKNYSVAKDALAQSEGLTNTQLGDIETGYLVAYAVGQFANGALGDRIGARWLVGAGLIATAFANIAFGVGQTFGFFLAAWVINGYAQSAGWPGCAKAFSQWFARAERGTAMGLWCTCYQVGPIVGTFLGTWLLVHWGWSWSFFGPAVVVLGFAVLFLALLRGSPRACGLPDAETYYAGKGGPDDSAGPVPHEAEEEAPTWADFARILGSRPIWTLGLTYVVLKFVRYSFFFWLPFYMSNQLGYGDGEAGYTSAAFDLAGIAGAIFAGLASDRLWQGRRAPIVVIMLLLLAVATYIYPQLSMMGRFENVIGIALIGFLLYGPDSVTSGVAAVDFGGRRTAAAAAGFINGLGSIGAALSGIVVGRVSQTWGWEAMFTLFSPMCLAAALLMATMWRTRAGTGSESA